MSIYTIIFCVLLLSGIAFVIDSTLLRRKTVPEPEPNNPLADEHNKPSDSVIEDRLKEEKFMIFKQVRSRLAELGSPVPAWRGPENGWVLTLEGQEANGCLTLTKENLTGYLALTNNQLVGMTTDERFPTEMLREINYLDWLFMDGGVGRTYKEIALVSAKHAEAFTRLIELSIFYS